MNQTTAEKILKKDLKLHPYNPAQARELSDTDKVDRMMFARWVRGQRAEHP